VELIHANCCLMRSTCAAGCGSGRAQSLRRFRSDYARLCARVQELTAADWSLEAIAHQLEVDGIQAAPQTSGAQIW
jgi:hypothetical protein